MSAVPNVVQVNPVVDLDFANTGRIPSGILCTRASVASYMDATGLPQLAAPNTPRLDWDGSGACRGLLVEGARTNVFINSDNHTATNEWEFSGTTAGADTKVGIMNFAKMTDTAANTQHGVYAYLKSLTSKSVFSARLYLKYDKADAKSCRFISVLNKPTPNLSSFSACHIDMLTGSAKIEYSAGVPISMWQVEAYPNSGIVVVIVNTNTPEFTGNQGAGYLAVRLTNETSLTNMQVAGNSYAGNGKHIWVGGIHQGMSSTIGSTYIPTTTAPAARAADVIELSECTVPPTATVVSQFAKYSQAGLTAGLFTAMSPFGLVSAPAATATCTLRAVMQSAATIRLEVTINSSTSANASLVIPLDTSVLEWRTAMSFTTSTADSVQSPITWACNGVSAGPGDADIQITGPFCKVVLGAAGPQPDTMFGYIRSFAMYSTASTKEELIEMSKPQNTGK